MGDALSGHFQPEPCLTERPYKHSEIPFLPQNRLHTQAVPHHDVLSFPLPPVVGLPPIGASGAQQAPCCKGDAQGLQWC